MQGQNGKMYMAPNLHDVQLTQGNFPLLTPEAGTQIPEYHTLSFYSVHYSGNEKQPAIAASLLHKDDYDNLTIKNTA